MQRKSGPVIKQTEPDSCLLIFYFKNFQVMVQLFTVGVQTFKLTVNSEQLKEIGGSGGCPETLIAPTYKNTQTLNVEILYIERVVFDELAA